MTTKELIKKYNIKAKKQWGQNFLLDDNLLRKMAKLSGIKQESTVVEIGPGLGSLTRHLLGLAKKVIAFEIDERLTEVLKAEFKQDNFCLVKGDFLQIKLEDYLNEQDSEIMVCANLPYYITTPILFKLFKSPILIQSISVLVQKEVAERFCALPNTKQYGAISVITQYKYEAKIIMKIAKEAFYPQPKVDSCVVLFKRIKAQEAIDEQAFFRLVKSCFKYRRKTIYNNYKEFNKDAVAILEAADIALNCRAEQLALDDYLRLFKIQNEKTSLWKD